MGLDTKTYWLTDRQSQCNFDFDFDLWTSENSSTRQVGRVRIRLPGGSTVQNEYRDLDTAGRQNIAGEGITKKNPVAGMMDREDNIVGLSGVTNNCSYARWKSK
jgi:hypothetical protein